MSIYAMDSGVWVKVADVGGYGSDGDGAGGGLDVSRYGDFSVPGVTPSEHVGDGVDGVLGFTYKTWRINASTVVMCQRSGLADFYMVGGGGGGGGVTGQYPTGGGGAGGLFIMRGMEFDSTAEGGAYVVTIGAANGGNTPGGDSSIVNATAGVDIGCGGGGHSWSTGDYVSCSYKNSRPGWGGGGDGGGGGKNGNPGSGCCAGKQNTHWIFGGTETIGDNNSGGCGSSAGKNGYAILQVLVGAP
jgi:hypothetical protein